MSGFLADNTIVLAVICGLVAVIYGIALTMYLLKQPAGNERMQEIARAVQEGAKAYLNRQYAIIGAVAVVLFLLIGFLGNAVHSPLIGWKAAIGFLIGAVASAAACVGFAVYLIGFVGRMFLPEPAEEALPE